jgi:hypothetical protein
LDVHLRLLGLFDNATEEFGLLVRVERITIAVALKAGPSAEKEAEVIAAWQAR